MKSPFETEDRAAFRATVRKFVEQELAPHADEWDEAGRIPWEVHERAGALGFYGFGIAEEYGGLGFDDCFMRVILGEELSKCGSGGVVAALTGCNIMTDPLQKLAGDEIKKRALPEIMSGKSGGALGITDHVGIDGHDNAKLHRLQPAIAEALLAEAGFRIADRSSLFANSEDDHTLMVYDERIYRQTDRFFFKAVPAED